MQADRFTISGLVAELDGRTVYRHALSGNPTETETLGIRLAETLLDQGAARVLESLTGDTAPGVVSKGASD